MAVFGGEDSPRHAFDPCLYVYDPRGGGQWAASPPAPSPAPLLGHAAASVGSTVYIFGGRTGGTNCADDDETTTPCETETASLFAIDTTADKGWQALEIPGGPSPRSFHAMASLGSTLYVFGGCGEQGRLNDLWALETSGGLAWECLSLGGDVEGLHPSPRGGAALLALPGGNGSFDPSAKAGQLVLLFGFDGEQRGDVWTFELDGSEGGWEDRTDDQQGDIPAPRSVFGAARVGPRKIFVFGMLLHWGFQRFLR